MLLSFDYLISFALFCICAVDRPHAHFSLYLSLVSLALNMANTGHNQMMKQWQFTRSGSPRDVLAMVDVPIPITCADDEVLVHTSHVSLNSVFPHRLMAHYGILDPVGAFIGRPCVPEMEFSGIVCDLRGANVKEFNTGNVDRECPTFLLFHYFL
jgi:hypothetical protein